LRILVVDDNSEQAATLGALLSAEGHEVRVAGDSFSALEIIADFVPEVGLLDIGMLEMDGCELARRIRADARLHDTVLIAQTGWGRESDRLRTEAAGFNHHLVKPINHALLERILLEIGNRPGVLETVE
jgi:CheY-like chemotaxis protein